ncbi:MAG TPA: cytochrome P450 [Micromonosporaceae bacterium]|nr:cytochrome P450 [Micromonosporaceae bacterium]
MSSDTYADSQRKIPRDGAGAGCPVSVDAEGVWHVPGYAAARAVLRSTDTRQGGFGVDDAGDLPGKMRPPVLWRDGPEHREDRRQTARFFTPRRVDEKYRGLMHRFADEQCERLRRRGTADLSQLSFALAVAVAGEVIGLTPARRGMARRLERFFTEHRSAPGWRTPGGIYRMAYMNSALAAFYLADVAPAIRVRRRRRRDDLISHLLDQGCNNGDIFGECVTFAAAGMATTREFITVAAWHLFTDAGLRTRYLDGDQAARAAILHELLRLEPVVGNLARWTTAELELPGEDGPVTIPAGARVDVVVAAANLDPAAVGDRPTQLCPGRPLGDGVADAGLAFGDGPHRCPGAHIAVQETDIFLTKLFAMPNLRMVQPPRSRIRAMISSYELNGLIVTVR